jgi:hypothetical protein
VYRDSANVNVEPGMVERALIRLGFGQQLPLLEALVFPVDFGSYQAALRLCWAS